MNNANNTPVALCPVTGYRAEKVATIKRIFTNAIRLGVDALHTAAALDIVAPIAGRVWVNLCCACTDRQLAKVDTALTDNVGCRVRDDIAGGCAHCAYTGRDTLVVSLVCEER